MVRFCSFSSVSFSVAVLLLTVASASMRVHEKTSESDIKAICESTIIPAYCFKLFNSDPRLVSIDLPSVATILIVKGQDKLSRTEKLIKTLIKKASPKPPPGGGPSLKERYLSCSENYDDALADILEAKQFIISHDYFGAQIHASAVLDDIVTCDDDLTDPTPDPSPLARHNMDASRLSRVILAVINHLHG
ncbi:hypothetical protein K2173_022419 [Erythroxylum novogranatense]|uniref:Pectinesterase inhibitor domain-containing protein n=1 Tax=Erythroxylum novogranatense TaxID=1862640 RepID=A0AAV8THR2_9ROSI|nr:hypothetical protein K2173_022419 [Erythroxylum novogranatense]